MNFSATRLFTLSITACLALATGCAAEDAWEETDGGTDSTGGVELRSTTTLGAGSTTWPCTNCGGNDPEINGTPVRDFDAWGDHPNESGLYFVGVRDTGDYLDLKTVGDEIGASDSNNVLHQGAAMIGMELLFEDGDGEDYALTITDYDTAGSLKTGGSPVPIFGFAYQVEKTEVWHNVCPEFQNYPNDAKATLLVGERYDNDLKTVSVPSVGKWVTIACNSQAAYKMKMMGYGPHGDVAGGNPATPDERQATLKMITADYCGGGLSFTQTGAPVHWLNDKGNVNTDDPLAAIEALWDEDGAICIDTPRLLGVSGTNSAALYAAIAAECSLPACTAQMIAAENYEWFTRANVAAQ